VEIVAAHSSRQNGHEYARRARNHEYRHEHPNETLIICERKGAALKSPKSNVCVNLRSYAILHRKVPVAYCNMREKLHGMIVAQTQREVVWEI
jgi:hypothetical protein